MKHTVNSILQQLSGVAANPRGAVEEHLKATGKGAVGCFPLYAPEEIVHASGFLPVGLWGGTTGVNRAMTVLPSFACSVMQSVTELQLAGVYDSLAAVIVSSACDTLKAMGQKWSREVPCIQFAHPRRHNLDAARVFVRAEYDSVRRRLEEACGVEIPDEAIAASINIYNRHRATMRQFSEVAADYPDRVSPVERHAVFKSALFMRKEEHEVLVRELIELLQMERPQPWPGVRVVVSGIMLEPVYLIQLLEDYKIAVAADDLGQESRQYRTDAPADPDPLNSLARRWQDMVGCPLVFDPAKRRITMLREMVEQRKADGLILCMMKFCEPEEFDYPLIKEHMEQHGIPMLQIEVDQQIQYVGQATTQVQGFVEMLEKRKSALI